MKENEIADSVAKLSAWLESWKTKNGAYNGYVIHRLNLKRMFLIHDTPWSQAPIIDSFLNLYQRTNVELWLEKAIEAANLQMSRLVSTYNYMYSGHEDDRFCGLVHNALANCSLLDLAQTLQEEGSGIYARIVKKYVDAVRINTDRFLISKLWVEEKGAFKVAEKDYYSPKQDRFIANMNSVAVENLIKLASFTGEQKYLRLAEQVGEFLLSLQCRSDNSLVDGSIAYQDGEPMDFVSIYTALALRGLDDLFYLTKDKKYSAAVARAASHLLNFRDPRFSLFYHGYSKSSLKKYPLFVAGAGIVLKALDDASRLTRRSFDVTDAVDTILSMQLANGGFPSFMGYNSSDNSRANGNHSRVWEDIVPTVGWNAHLFEYLTRFVPKDFEIPRETETKTTLDSRRNYFYMESSKTSFIFGWNPFQSFTFYIVPNKRIPLGFAILDIRALAKLVIESAKDARVRFSHAKTTEQLMPFSGHAQVVG